MHVQIPHDPQLFYSQKTPVQILVLPTGSNTCDLHDENTIVIQEFVNLVQELTISSNTDVLRKHCENDGSG